LFPFLVVLSLRTSPISSLSEPLRVRKNGQENPLDLKKGKSYAHTRSEAKDPLNRSELQGDATSLGETGKGVV
jgi:hypothetical protein